jgi:tRNA (guanine37-N1)-methyltransferase
MRFDILTTFSDQVNAMLDYSIVGKARERGLVEVNVHNLRDFTDDKHKTTDEHPFGGGPGMLMLVEPIYKALKQLNVYPTRPATTQVWLTAANGEVWSQPHAVTAADELNHVVIICGHYEGVDYRVIEHLIDNQVSIGKYVLSGGELAAGVIVDSISRLLPGVLGNPDSLNEESHNDDLEHEYPQYTRPATFTTAEGETWAVPEILLSGNHAAIKQWQKDNARKV